MISKSIDTHTHDEWNVPYCHLNFYNSSNGPYFLNYAKTNDLKVRQNYNAIILVFYIIVKIAIRKTEMNN